MPELPDLQVFSHNLNKMLKGKKILWPFFMILKLNFGDF
jgi:hypothetical protein